MQPTKAVPVVPELDSGTTEKLKINAGRVTLLHFHHPSYQYCFWCLNVYIFGWCESTRIATWVKPFQRISAPRRLFNYSSSPRVCRPALALSSLRGPSRCTQTVVPSSSTAWSQLSSLWVCVFQRHAAVRCCGFRRHHSCHIVGPCLICITYLCHIQLEKSNTSNLLLHLYIIVLIMWNRKTKVSHGHSRHNNMVSLQMISGCLFFIYLLIFMLNKPGKWNIFSVQQHNVWPVWLCCMFMFLYIRGSNLRVSSYAREWSALELLFRVSAAM